MKQENITLEEAYQNAKDTFKYFWRELSWEYRRIVPALDMAMVKIAFSDDSLADLSQQTEYLWVNDLSFDGTTIYGTVLNQPHWLTNVSEGDVVQVGLDVLTDWIFTINGKVYGAFTINQMRASMSEEERVEHDEMWGLEFGDPHIIELATTENEEDEHPMSLNMLESLKETLKTSNEVLEYRDEWGETMLHYEALAGNLAQVVLLLSYKLDATIVNKNGDRAIDLAKKMGWNQIVDILEEVEG